MNFRKIKETDTGETTRCGRCALILPDETLSYCPACGALFSVVPPTNTYVDLAQRRLEGRFRRHRAKLILMAFAFFGCFFSCFGLLNFFIDEITIAHASTDFREVRFYFYDFDNLPKLPIAQKREAIAIALQSFEDHFHFALKKVLIRQDEAPTYLEPVFAETEKRLLNQPLDPFTLPLSLMSYWEKSVFPAAVRRWQNDPGQTLDVVITNLPLHADAAVSGDIETRHLGGGGLVSGLANPGMVIVSTYRAHNDNPRFARDRPPTANREEKARFIGEFIIAHELGHALLGLADVVLDPEDYLSPIPGTNLRTPASPARPDFRNCLMHSDSGGGLLAWDSLRKRNMGEASNCTAYDNVLASFRLEQQSVQLLKLGYRDSAQSLHDQAIALSEQPTAGWVSRSWRRDSYLFASVIKRWWLGMFMIQFRHDQL